MDLKVRLLIAMALALSVPAVSSGARAVEPASQVMLDLEEHFNNDGISWDEDPLDGDLDYRRLSLPAEQLPATKAVVEWNGVQFLFPAKEDGKYNNIACYGQVISLPPAAYAKVHFLAAATNGVYQDNFVIRYEDGSEAAVRLKVPRLQGTPGFAGKIVLKVDHKHDTEGDTPMACNLYGLDIGLEAEKTAISLVLPDRPDIHIFAITLEAPL